LGKLNAAAVLFWNNKERLVFVILLCVLGFYVYKALPQTQDSTEAGYSFPRDTVDESLVPEMPAPPQARKLGDWKSVYMPNPFWYLASTSKTDKGEAGGNEDVNISLLRIQKKGKEYRAQLQTAGSAKKWYVEGEQFESFVLLKIDPEAKTCEVHSERLGKTILLKVAK